MPDFRTQLSPAGQRTAHLDARAGEARPKGKSEGMTGRSLLQTRQRKVFPALRCNQSHIRFNTSSIYVANRFFGAFLTQESTVLPSSPVPFCTPALYIQARENASPETGVSACRKMFFDRLPMQVS